MNAGRPRRAGTRLCVCLLVSAPVPLLRAQLLGPAPAEQRKAVVTIYAIDREGVHRGSGAFISAAGDILTCYHVVEGAQRIIVIAQDAPGGISNVIVEHVSPETDLALLRLTHPAPSLPYLHVATQKPRHLLDQKLRAYGYQMGLHRQVVSVEASQDEEAPAVELVDETDKQSYAVFNPSTKLSVIPLHMTIYHGLSGGPLVSPQGVIGVISGAISQGGAIAWAIPVSAPVFPPIPAAMGKEPKQVPWAPLTLMAEPWTNMRADVSSARPTMEAVQRFIDSMEQTRLAFSAFQQAVKAYNANTADTIEALGEIPERSQSRRSSEIARDPELRQLNGRIASLFNVAPELEARFTEAQRRMQEPAAQSERELYAITGEVLRSANALPPTENNRALVRAVDAEITSTRERIEAHPFPQIKTPSVVIRDADSVSIAQLRSYLIQTRANLEEALTPAFNGKVDAFFVARESIALPVEHLFAVSSH